MTVVVENSADQVLAYTEGKGIFPIPPEVAADNAKQGAKDASSKETKVKVDATKTVSGADGVSVSESDKKADSHDAEGKGEDPDDIEGDDGLTPREKRELTAKMLKAIGKRTKALKDAESFAATQYNATKMAEERAAALQTQLDVLKAQSKPVKADDGVKEPQRADFKTDQEHWDAMVDYRVEKKLQVAEAARQKAAEEQRQAEVVAHAKAKIDRAIELVPDFKEVTENVDTIIPPFVAGYMQESDMFGELGYHFAKHPEDVERLSKFTDGIRPGTPQFEKAVTRQLVELGKIESTLTPFAKRAKSQDDNGDEPSDDKNASQASPETGSSPSKPRVAPIIRPIAASSASQVQKDENEMSSSEITRAWQKKHGVQLTARKRH